MRTLLACRSAIRLTVSLSIFFFGRPIVLLVDKQDRKLLWLIAVPNRDEPWLAFGWLR
jgi:hypothetical protein